MIIKKYFLFFLFIVCPLFAMEPANKQDIKQEIIAFYTNKYPALQAQNMDLFAQDVFNLLPSLESKVLPENWLTQQADSVFQFYKKHNINCVGTIVSSNECLNSFYSALKISNPEELEKSGVLGKLIEKTYGDIFDTRNQENEASLYEILLADLLPLRYQINQKFSDKS